MKLRVVGNNEPPPSPKRNQLTAKAGAIVALLVVVAIASGIWLLSNWFSAPVSVAYLRQQSASYTQCEKNLLRYETGPITRYALYTIHSVCESGDRREKTVEEQQAALGNLQ